MVGRKWEGSRMGLEWRELEMRCSTFVKAGSGAIVVYGVDF